MSNLVINENGTKRWRNEAGKYHREDGPAVEYTNGDKEYWVHDKLHRTDGPAVIYSNGTKEYFINGKQYSSLEEGLMDQALV